MPLSKNKSGRGGDWPTAFPKLPLGLSIQTYEKPDGVHFCFCVSSVGQSERRSRTFYEDDMQEKYEEAIDIWMDLRGVTSVEVDCPYSWKQVLQNNMKRRRGTLCS